MKRILFACGALALASAAPASAQMAGGPGMPMGGGKSCVMNGQFVPCPPAGGMEPGMMDRSGMAGGGMAMQDGGMERRMTARERREQRRMMRQQNM